MNCPSCGDGRSCRYLIKRDRKETAVGKRYYDSRTDFRAKCGRCKWEGLA